MVMLIEVKALPIIVNKCVSRIDKSYSSRTLHLRWITLKMVRNLNKILRIHAEIDEYISNWRCGQSKLDTNMVSRIAQILNSYEIDFWSV